MFAAIPRSGIRFRRLTAGVAAGAGLLPSLASMTAASNAHSCRLLRRAAEAHTPRGNKTRQLSSGRSAG